MDPLTVGAVVAAALESCGAPYSIGGSVASAFCGEPRATLDIDIVVALPLDRVTDLVRMLEDAFYVDADAIFRAIRQGSSTNLIHLASGIKVDLFMAASTLDRLQLARRRAVAVGPADRTLFVHSAEDILLQKLHWYRAGGGVSERQWRDVLAILLRQGADLDRDYLRRTADDVELTDLLARAEREADVT